jgi:excisionase family DNA binding protein
MGEVEDKLLYSISELSWMLGLSHQMIRKCIKEGRIEAIRPMGPTGDYRIHIDEINNFLEKIR